MAFRSLTESIDTSTPGGKLTFHLFEPLAEFERDLIRERTMAGLAAGRARGRRGGRPTVWTPEKARVALEMYAREDSDLSTIAKVLGVSRASIYRLLSDRGRSRTAHEAHPEPLEGDPLWSTPSRRSL